MIWTPNNIFTVRDTRITDRAGKQHLVKLYASGWAIGPYADLDVWAACRVLNDMEAHS
ncbi:hypothetical protein [Nitrospira sp. BLG_1]|uniref:hypothetical protein n=1 Tax=Nitrospira sp. BLG_1 TaxID=3395883 RepID=UPI0039BC4676